MQPGFEIHPTEEQRIDKLRISTYTRGINFIVPLSSGFVPRNRQKQMSFQISSDSIHLTCLCR